MTIDELLVHKKQDVEHSEQIEPDQHRMVKDLWNQQKQLDPTKSRRGI